MHQSVGLVILCSRRLPEDGTPVPKHLGVMNCIVEVVFYCDVLSVCVV